MIKNKIMVIIKANGSLYGNAYEIKAVSFSSGIVVSGVVRERSLEGARCRAVVGPGCGTGGRAQQTLSASRGAIG